jgi:hypothetical protein
MLTASRSMIGKTATIVIRSTNPAVSSSLASRAFSVVASTNRKARLQALCKANSQVIEDQIHLIDSVINHNPGQEANKVFKTVCPIVGSTLGRQIRHSMDHLEKVALEGLNVVRDNDTPIDLHYDVREHGTIHETDIFEARERALFIRDIFDSVRSGVDKDRHELAESSGKKVVRVSFDLPSGVRDDVHLFPLTSTLEREMAFSAHHALHHHRLLRVLAAAGKVGLELRDLPPGFGLPPSMLGNGIQDVAA